MEVPAEFEQQHYWMKRLWAYLDMRVQGGCELSIVLREKHQDKWGPVREYPLGVYIILDGKHFYIYPRAYGVQVGIKFCGECERTEWEKRSVRSSLLKTSTFTCPSVTDYPYWEVKPVKSTRFVLTAKYGLEHTMNTVVKVLQELTKIY